jgi:hypothetical protein
MELLAHGHMKGSGDKTNRNCSGKYKRYFLTLAEELPSIKSGETMIFSKRWIPVLSVVILCAGVVGACNVPQAPAPTATPAATETTVPSPTALPGLSDTLLQNGSYQTPQYNRSVTLKDGKYEAGSGADYFMASLLPLRAKGDLNGDGLEDAAVLLAENGGGSGVFVSLVGVLNQNGKPVQTGGVLIDDRPKVNALEIQGGKILLNGVIHGPNDPMVSPTLEVSETYRLVKRKLALVHLTSKVPDGRDHVIRIESPADGSAASGSVQVKGSMPIGPFENALVYHLVDADGNQLAEGPFATKSDGDGAPATFDNTIDISTIASGSEIRLELVEVSMANGSAIALDSIALTVK